MIIFKLLIIASLGVSPLAMAQSSEPSPFDLFVQGLQNARAVTNGTQQGAGRDLNAEVTRGNTNYELPGRGQQQQPQQNQGPRNCTTTFYGNVANTTCN